MVVKTSKGQNKGPDEEGIVTLCFGGFCGLRRLVRIKAPMKRGLLLIILATSVGITTSQNKGPDEEGIVTGH